VQSTLLTIRGTAGEDAPSGDVLVFSGKGTPVSALSRNERQAPPPLSLRLPRTLQPPASSRAVENVTLPASNSTAWGSRAPGPRARGASRFTLTDKARQLPRRAVPARAQRLAVSRPSPIQTARCCWADEPTAPLDSRQRAKAERLVRAAFRRRGGFIVTTTPSSLSVADRFGLHPGRADRRPQTAPVRGAGIAATAPGWVTRETSPADARPRGSAGWRHRSGPRAPAELCWPASPSVAASRFPATFNYNMAPDGAGDFGSAESLHHLRRLDPALHQRPIAPPRYFGARRRSISNPHRSAIPAGKAWEPARTPHARRHSAASSGLLSGPLTPPGGGRVRSR